MAGMKRAYTLEWASSDGDSFSATDDQGRRTMGRSTKTIQFQEGGRVGIQDHQNGVHYLHKVHTSDPGFLMVNAGEGTMGPGCSADEPETKEKRGRAGPAVATAMTAATTATNLTAIPTTRYYYLLPTTPVRLR